MRINNPATSLRTGEPSSPNRDFNRSLERLSTGLRINPSFGEKNGLVVTETLRSAARQAAQAGQNARSCITAIRITEGEANLENAINNLTLSNTSRQTDIPQSIAELLNA